MEPHIYHFKRWVQAAYCAMGLSVIAICILFVVHTGFQALFIAFASMISIPGIFCCWWAIGSRLMFSDTEISVSYGFSEDSAQLSNIEGWREDSGGNSGLVWVLQFRDNSGSLRVNQNFDVDGFFFDFLSKLADLNDGEISILPR